MFTFNHFNFNVADLEKSLAFYREALGLEPVRRQLHSDLPGGRQNGFPPGVDLVAGSSPEV